MLDAWAELGCYALYWDACLAEFFMSSVFEPCVLQPLFNWHASWADRTWLQVLGGGWLFDFDAGVAAVNAGYFAEDRH